MVLHRNYKPYVYNRFKNVKYFSNKKILLCMILPKYAKYVETSKYAVIGKIKRYILNPISLETNLFVI